MNLWCQKGKMKFLGSNKKSDFKKEPNKKFSQYLIGSSIGGLLIYPCFVSHVALSLLVGHSAAYIHVPPFIEGE